MSSTLEIMQVGVVGVTPRLLFLRTAESEATVLSAGFLNRIEGTSGINIQPGDYIFSLFGANNELQEIFIPIFGAGGIITLFSIAGSAPGIGPVQDGLNLGTGTPVFAGKVGDNLTFNNIKAGTNIAVSLVGDDVTIAATGGGSSSFEFLNTFFVAKGGNDANAGNSIDQPFLTFQTAVNAAQALPLVTGQRTCVVCLDAGTYTGNITISEVLIDIYAPYCTQSGNTITVQAPLNPALTQNVANNLTFGSWYSVTYAETSTGSPITSYNGVTLSLKHVYATSITLGARSCMMNFDYWDAFSCSINSSQTNPGIRYAFAINNTGATFPLATSSVNLASWAFSVGYIGDTPLITSNTIDIGAVDQDIDVKWNGAAVHSTPVGTNVVLNVSSAMDNDAPLGWEALFIRDGGTGNVKVTFDGGINYVSAFNNPETQGDGGWFTLKKIANNLWFVGGYIQNPNIQVSYYVSKTNGSDVDGDGTQANPYASIGAAVAAVGAPTNTTNIFIVDGEIYNESVVIAQNNINLIGPEAAIVKTLGGDALTITTTTGAHGIVLGGLVSTAGLALKTTLDSQVLLRVTIMNGQIEVNDNNVYLTGQDCASDLNVIGTGRIFSSVDRFNGSVLSDNVFIISPEGSSAPTFALGSDGHGGELQAFSKAPGAGSLYVSSTDNAGLFNNRMTNQSTDSVLEWHLPNFDNLNYGSNTVALMPSMRLNNDPAANIVSFSQSIPSGALIGGSSLTVATAFSGGSYRLLQLYINYGGVDFAGGDRNIQIEDSVSLYSVIPAATLATISTLNAGWGSVALPFPTNIAINTPTSSGVNLVARYNGGTTDYATGTLLISGIWERVS